MWRGITSPFGSCRSKRIISIQCIQSVLLLIASMYPALRSRSERCGATLNWDGLRRENLTVTLALDRRLARVYFTRICSHGQMIFMYRHNSRRPPPQLELHLNILQRLPAHTMLHRSACIYMYSLCYLPSLILTAPASCGKLPLKLGPKDQLLRFLKCVSNAGLISH